MTLAKIYPGMICSAIEVFTVEGEAMFIQKGKVSDISEAPYSMIMIAADYLKKDKLVAQELEKMHPENETQQIFQFYKCRYGGLDFNADIKNGNYKKVITGIAHLEINAHPMVLYVNHLCITHKDLHR